jgi:hypothetical protein
VARELQKPLSRGELNRLLIANALTKTWPNVILPAGVVVAGIFVGLPLGLAVAIAVVAWLALSVATYFDADEAEAVAERVRARRRGALEAGRQRVSLGDLAPPVAQQLRHVLQQERHIREAVDRAELPFSEVLAEVETFVRAAERTAGRAQLLYEYLASDDPRRVESRLRQVQGDPSKAALAEALTTQLNAMQRAARELEGFYTEMERIGVELGNIRGQLLSVSATTESAAQRDLAADVRDLREQMGAVAEGMSEALEQTGSAPPAGAA